MRNTGLLQTLTYWSPAATDRYGAQSFGDPILIKGRWEDREEEVRTPSGGTIVSKAVVFVDRDLLLDGYLGKGDLTAVADPTITRGAYEIQAWATVPDLRNVSVERRAFL